MCKLNNPVLIVKEKNSDVDDSQQQRRLKKGTTLGAISIALLVFSTTLTIPHLQARRDSLGCDTMCYGSLTSGRSCLSVIGAAIMGRLSDSSGRKICMVLGCIASLVGMIITHNTESIQGMWLGMIPGALLQQNFSILKALLSDLHDESSSPSKRASSMGMLGMAVGLAFMAGPLTGSTILTTFQQANALGMIFVIASLGCIILLPDLKKNETKKTKATNDGKKEQKKSTTTTLQFFNVKAARTPGAILFMITRILMALAFHVFQTIWSEALKTKFDFGPSDYGKYLSFIGLAYAFSQGFLSKFLLGKLGGDTSSTNRVRIILGCCTTLGLGRFIVYHTNSLNVVYMVFTVIVTALGMLNTILTADTTYLASSDEIGSLFGLLASMESGAGMVGPLLGGILSRYVHPIYAPLFFVMGLYTIVGILMAWGYKKHVLDTQKKRQHSNVADDDIKNKKEL